MAVLWSSSPGFWEQAGNSCLRNLQKDGGKQNQQKQKLGSDLNEKWQVREARTWNIFKVKAVKLADARDESSERHKNGINQNIQNIVTVLWVRMSAQDGMLLLKLTGKRELSAWLEKCYLTASYQKWKEKTNLDINIGMQKQAGSRKADLSSTWLKRTTCG